MARDAELRARITAKDDASKVIDKVADAADELESGDHEIKVGADTDQAERDIAGLLSKVDKLGAGDAANLLLTTNATSVAGEIVDLVAKLDSLDAEDPQVDVTIANIAQLTGDLDQIKAKAQAINDTPIKLDTSGATDGIRQVGTEADQSRSVLANMVGNSTQDLGALGGVAGSAGMAIGQLAEYATEGGIKLSNLAAVAGPLIGVGLAVQGITQHFKSLADAKAFDEAQVKDFTEAIREGGDAAENLADQLRAAGEVKSVGPEWIGGGDFNRVLAEAGVGVEQWARLVTGSREELYRWADAARAAGIDTKEVSKVVIQAEEAQDNYATATKNAAVMNEVFGSSSASAIDATGFLGDAVNVAAEALEKSKKAAEEAAEAQAEFDAAVSDANIALIEGVDASEAFASALDRVNEASELDFAQMAQDTVASFDDVKSALDDIEDKSKIDWSNFDITPDEYSELKGMPDTLAAVTDAVAGMRGSVQTELQAAFDTGGIDAYTEKATFFRDQVIDQFPAKFKAMGASTEEAAAQTQALVEDLGLLPEQVEVMIQLTREEEARNALEAFSSVISQMPQNIQVAINTAIAQGDVEGALAILNDQLINRGYDPIMLPVDADIAPATATTEEIAGQTLETATIPVEADPAAAETGVDTFVSDTEAQEPIVNVDSNIQEALATMAWIKIFAALMPATVNINANPIPALGTLSALQAMRPVVTVTADANTSSAERELNSVARDRDAVITARVVESDVARWYRLNGRTG